MAEALSGRCLCGAVRFSALPQKRSMDVCHCGMCRRWSGGVFMAVPCTDVSVEDETRLGVYVSSEWGERLFCKRCGSSLFWRMRAGGDHVAVSFQSLDDISGIAFTEEIFIDEKPAVYSFAEATEKRTGADVMAAFAAERDS